MPTLIALLHTYGLWIVFTNVLLEQAGLPLPAFPVLILAGALAANHELSLAACLSVAVLACLLSDQLWYAAGRRYGKRVLSMLCRISLSPDSCVSQTEDIFTRWGVKSLLVAKFIPGFNTIAPPLSGALGITRPVFLMYSLAAALLWAGTGLAIGAVFHASIDAVIAILGTLGEAALIGIGVLLALFLLLKYRERRRFLLELRMARISVDELRELMEGGKDPIVVDARSVTARQMLPPIPGAVLFGHEDHAERFDALPRAHPIVVYCSCPNEASAAAVARTLVARGFQQVRPLVGGLEAWNATVVLTAGPGHMADPDATVLVTSSGSSPAPHG
jgi:membrane protein DedA with SNARE-associated domain/rhodanese-related sulfurtransferase